jgi:hypothetical protein
MSERPRLTVQIDGSEVILYLNLEARSRLISELQSLDRHSDHFHVLGSEVGDDLQTSQIAYRPKDQLAYSMKVCLRYDDWDAEHFPHLMAAPETS